MSVTICWNPTSKAAKHFAGGTSTSFDILKQTFGDRIGPSDVPTLRAMALAAQDTFYAEVADVIDMHGEIKVWGEY